MKETIRKALHHFLILTVSLSCLAIATPVAFPPAGPLCSMDSCPLANSLLDRQLNRLDNGLLAFTNKNNGNLFTGSSLPEYAAVDNPAYARCFSGRFSLRNALPLSTCLWYVPLLPIPPPQA